MPGPTYVFADFEFDPATGELRRGGQVVRLEPQPAKALALLLERPGELVTREELRAELWPGDVSVDFDRGLAYCLSQIRGALGDSAEAPRFVETLPRRGYRFIAPVGPAAAGPDATPSETAPPNTTRALLGWLLLVVVGWAIFEAATYYSSHREQPTILAVAVFDNETGDAAYDTFVAGFSDAIVANLFDIEPTEMGLASQNRVLRMPRSERDLADIAFETGATHVVIGQFRRTDEGLRVLAHLIRLSDGVHVWGRTFGSPDDRLEGLQAQVAAAVGRAVRERLLDSGQSAAAPDPDAFLIVS